MGIFIKVIIGSLLILFVTSCGSGLRDAYLNNVVEQADQAQVKSQLGPPAEVKSQSQGGEEWIYRDYQPSYPTKSFGTCTEYRLRFDTNKVFRDWKRKKCQENKV